MTAKALRWTAVGVGVLFWISDLSTLVGGVITGVLPSSAAAVAGLHTHATQFVAGVLVTHINDFAIVGYGVLLYTVLVRFSPSAALGVAAFKVVEAVLLLFAAVVLLSMAGSPTNPAADLALGQQFWATRISAFAYLVSTPVLNLVLFQTRLVPRWLSGWGLVACAMLAGGLAIGVGDPTRGFEPGQVLVIPIILWELAFATWLIVKGFNTAGAYIREETAPIMAA